MKYFIVIELRENQIFVKIPVEDSLEVVLEVVGIMIKSPVMHVLGVLDEENNVITEINDFKQYFDTL